MAEAVILSDPAQAILSPQFEASNGPSMDCVRSVGQPKAARVGPGISETEVLTDPRGAMYLNCAIKHG